MKLVSFRKAADRIGVGVVRDGAVRDVTAFIEALAIAARAERGLPRPSGMLRLLQAGPAGMAALRAHVEAAGFDGPGVLSLAETALLAPVPRPGKIVAVGRNYADHAKETGVDPFELPRIIAKLPSSVVGEGAAVALPVGVVKLDFEAELGVVIGAFARTVDERAALDAVAGYTILNDVSAREFQFDVAPPQTTFAKSMDGFCPMGPWLVTRDEIPNPQALALACFVNDREMQRANTADMLFPVARLIAYLSRFMTLEPGDVIATGTPAGIGAFRDPPVWLKAGDRVRIDIESIGTLEHGVQ